MAHQLHTFQNGSVISFNLVKNSPDMLVFEESNPAVPPSKRSSVVLTLKRNASVVRLTIKYERYAYSDELYGPIDTNIAAFRTSSKTIDTYQRVIPVELLPTQSGVVNERMTSLLTDYVLENIQDFSGCSVVTWLRGDMPFDQWLDN